MRLIDAEKRNAIIYVIENEYRRASLADLCERWGVTYDDFYDFLHAPTVPLCTKINGPEDLPPSGVDVLVCWNGKVREARYVEIIKDWSTRHCATRNMWDRNDYPVTHWTHLPAPPKEDES